jgi:hypothetical protein
LFEHTALDVALAGESSTLSFYSSSPSLAMFGGDAGSQAGSTLIMIGNSTNKLLVQNYSC